MTDAVIAPSAICPDIIERLRSEASELHDAAKLSEDVGDARFCEAAAAICEEAAAEIERLRAESLRLEAELALRRGTLAEPEYDPEHEPWFHVEHDVPPTTPRE